MIVKISQTASNVKQLFDINSEGLYSQGEVGNVSRFQTITISNKNTTIKGVYNLSKWTNYIPFRWLFGKSNITRAFRVYKNDNDYANIVLSKHGLLKSCYIIELYSGEVFHCYRRSKGSFSYVSIYYGDNQIALIETYLNTNDYKYTHKLYIKEDYDEFADVLSLFVLYYSNYNFCKRFHMSKGSYNQKSWSFSRYNNKYNPKWHEINFPDEDFFGKKSIR